MLCLVLLTSTFPIVKGQSVPGTNPLENTETIPSYAPATMYVYFTYTNIFNFTVNPQNQGEFQYTVIALAQQSGVRIILNSSDTYVIHITLNYLTPTTGNLTWSLYPGGTSNFLTANGYLPIVDSTQFNATLTIALLTPIQVPSSSQIAEQVVALMQQSLNNSFSNFYTILDSVQNAGATTQIVLAIGVVIAITVSLFAVRRLTDIGIRR